MDVQNVTSTTSTAPRSWWEIRNATGDIAEVFIYDQIGEDFWTGGGVTAKRFVDELGKITARQIHLRINSPGGSVFDANAIHNALTRHPAKVTTFIDGLAASAASYIALAGERVVMASNALYMIHNPMGGAVGTADDMRQMATVLDKVRDTILGIYETKTGQSTEDLTAAMDAETWYTAQEAMDAGFVDEVGVELAVAASLDLRAISARMHFKHVPDITEQSVETPDEDVPTDSGTDGASEPAASGGAPEPVNRDVYVPGVGFAHL